MQLTPDRLLTACIMSLFGLFFLIAGIYYIATSPYFSRAASGSVILKIMAQGNHKENDRVKATVTFYDGPEKAFDGEQAAFTYRSGAFTGTVALPADFKYQNRYALFIKPEKYAGRLFCSAESTGQACTVPQMIFLTSANAYDLTKTVFYAGDIPPMNGKVDAADMSMILRDLGKTATGEAVTDVNNDGITDIVDYSLALYSLAHSAVDDTIHLTAPPSLTPTVPLSPTVTATPSPTFSLYPTSTPAPTVTTVPTLTPTSVPPSLTPAPTATPAPTNTPTPTPLPRLGKNCSNGTQKVNKPINPYWDLNVLPIPYGHSQYVCVPVQSIVLHWSDSPNFSGNGATWGALNSKNVVCGLAIDDKETLQMSNFYDDKVTWEGCSTADNSINIEINGTEFDLWYDKNCNVVNPSSNNALAAGELQQAKQRIATQYGISTSVLDWENDRYLTIMKAQEKKVLEAVRYLLLYYNVSKDQVTGHFKLTSSKPDPGPRFLDCIRKKL